MNQKLNLLVGLVVIAIVSALVAVTPAIAQPTVPLFLSVDVDGYNAGGGQSLGPTEPGYEGFEGAEGLLLDPAIDWSASGTAGLTNTYSTSEGDVTVNIVGITTDARGARNRGGDGTAYPLQGVYQDFLFAQRNFGADQFGRNSIKLQLSGLSPNQQYQLTGFAREQAFAGEDQAGDSEFASYQAWTDLASLGGLDGPAAWMDANVGADASYDSVFTDDDMDANTPNVDTGYKNPIPSLARSPTSGPDSQDPYHYSATFVTTADAGGIVTVYTWSDGNSFAPNVQGASLINGLQIGIVPEPASLALFVVGLFGIAGLRRRVR